MPDLPYGGRALAAIHARSNQSKHEAYWLGFLRGILASEKIEDLELPSLRAEAEAFLNLMHDEDAAEILRDLDTHFDDYNGEIYDVVECILDQRQKHFVHQDDKDQANRLFGFCAGIACDGRITLQEVVRLIEEIDVAADLEQDPRVVGLRANAVRAIADGRITPEESEDIATWICRLVGDSCADTGLATFGNSPVVDDGLDDPAAVVITAHEFVVTGAFLFAPRKVITARLVDLGGVVAPTVTRRTDYLVVGSEASRDWKHSHQGNKLISAREMRERFGRPAFVAEGIIRKVLGEEAGAY